MSLSYYNPRDRYRRRFMSRMTGIFAAVCIAGIFVGFGFLLGRQYASQEVLFLRQQVVDMRAERDSLQDVITKARVDAQTAIRRFEQLRETYEEKLPDSGAFSDLVELLRRRVDEGADPDRLAFIIRSAQPPRNCTEPQIRRFVVFTPAYKGTESQLDIEEASLILKGSGSSAKNKEGAVEAWYDPSKSVSITFARRTGESETKTGVMPLYHSVVSGNREYRFTIEEGARSFAKVIFDSCDYP